MPTASNTAQPPLGWWSVTWRYLVAFWVGAAFWGLIIVSVLEEQGEDVVLRDGVGGPLALDVAIGIVALLVMGYRRRWPLAIGLVVAAATTVSVFSIGAWSIVAVSVATRRRWREIAILAVASFAAGLVYEFTGPTGPTSPWVVAVVFNALSQALPVAIGLYIGARRELVAQLRHRADTAEREQAMRMAQARVTERARIAREMHDVIAHRLSLVAMHAGALVYRDDLDRAQVHQTAELVRESAHQALSELREVLGVLRDPSGTPTQEPVVEPPQPTFRDIADLVAAARRAGSVVHLGGSLIDAPATGSVPDAVGRAAYRMVQEALTNARKHAPGAPVFLRLDGGVGEGVRLEVRNPVVTVWRDKPPGAGLGLTGLAERAVLAGGSFEHVEHAGWFIVRAWLPWTP